MALPKSDLNKKPDMLTAMDLAHVLPKTAEVINGHLHIGGVDMVELAHKEGTALYVMDEADICHRMDSYKKQFASNYHDTRIVYASKAFLNRAMCKIIASKGLFIDVSGGGELAIALAAGIPAENVVVHGNNKTPLELEEAIEAGVGRIVVDTRIELGRISEIAQRLGKTQKVFMRVTPGVEADTHEYIQTGCEDSKFGFTVQNDWAINCVQDFLDAPNVELAGLHCHIGSQIFALDCFAEAAEVMVGLLDEIRSKYNYTIAELDMGGGMGVAYSATDSPCSIEDFAENLCSSVKNACEKFNFPTPILLVEPGRSLVANAGVTLYTVGVMKTLPNIRKFIAVDGGMSDNIRTALYHATYEPLIANRADEPRSEIVTLCGKHCESGDAVVIDMPMQKAQLGDIACVLATGAYCHTMANNYNGQPRPAIVFVKDGEYRVVTRRESYEDLMRRDID